MDPAALIIAGSWHTPEHYATLATSLTQAGFPTVRVPKLPTAVEELPVPASATLAHDTEVIRTELASLADAGHAITIVCHSYGGLVGSTSVDGYLWVQRRAAGKRGGVVHIVYMAAFVIPAGTALADAFGGDVPEFLEVDEGRNVLLMRDARLSFYNDLSEGEGEMWVGKCVFCSLSCFRDRIGGVVYEAVGKGLEATYLVCERDSRLPVVVQEGMAMLLGEGRRMVYVDAGHCAMISAPERVARVVWEAWETSRGRVAE